MKDEIFNLLDNLQYRTASIDCQRSFGLVLFTWTADRQIWTLASDSIYTDVCSARITCFFFQLSKINYSSILRAEWSREANMLVKPQDSVQELLLSLPTIMLSCHHGKQWRQQHGCPNCQQGRDIWRYIRERGASIQFHFKLLKYF